MQLTIEQGALNRALARVTSVVERRNTILILSNILIDATGDDVWLVATDLDIEARARVDAVIHKAGATTVPASTMADIVRGVPNGAEIALETKDHRLQVQFGRSRYQVPMLPAGDFPVRAKMANGTDFVLSAVDFRKMLGEVAPAMSTEEVRYYLQGAFLHVISEAGAPFLRFTATDGHRLMMTTRPGAGVPTFAGVIVPRKMVAEMAKALDGRAGDVAFCVSPQGVSMEFGDIQLQSKVIDGAFPDYVRVVPASWDHEIEVDRLLLLNAVQRVVRISNEKARAVKLVFDNDGLTLQVRNMEAGEGTEEIEIAYQGAVLEVGVNGAYLVDALQQTDADIIVLRIGDAASPVRLEPAVSDPEHGLAVAVIMPLRV